MSVEQQVVSPLTQGETCKLISTKQERLYVHTYNPTNMLREIQSNLSLSDQVMNQFDPEMRFNCCNVIAISLYFKSCDEDVMTKYLASIARGVKNVEKYLPTWVVRVYFSTSVFRCIQQTSRESAASIAYERIIGSGNVEVYTYECPESDRGPVEYSRTYRFLPLSEVDVNEWISMEADGTVTIWHCKLITWFSKSPTIFYMPIAINLNLFKNIPTLNVFDAYSHWLSWYKSVFRREFFKTHQTVYDIMAGMIGCKLKIKRDVYLERVNSLRNEIVEFHRNPKEFIAHHVHVSDNITFHVAGKYYTPSAYYNTLKVATDNCVTLGFDEMVLMELFKEVISTDLTDYNTYRRVVKVNGHRMETNAIAIEQSKFKSDRKVLFIESMVCADLPVMQMLEFRCDRTHTFSDAIMYFLQELTSKGLITADVIVPQLPNLAKLCKGDDKFFTELFYAIDGILMQHVVDISRPFDLIITFDRNRRSISELVNLPYSNSYDIYYDDAAGAGRGGGIFKQTKHRRMTRKCRRKPNKKRKHCKKTRHHLRG
jgi:hypothetical protein